MFSFGFRYEGLLLSNATAHLRQPSGSAELKHRLILYMGQSSFFGGTVYWYLRHLVVFGIVEDVF